MAGRQTLLTFECAVPHRGEGDVSGEPRRVLVVDDDLDHAELVQRTLERQGFAVTVVSDGFACFQAVETTAYSVILLDHSLPRVNGLEVLAELRRREISMPVVIVAGQGEEHLAIEVIKAGGMDFVVKMSGYFEALPTVLHKVLEQYALARETRSLHRETERRLRDSEALVDRLVRDEPLQTLRELASGSAHQLNNLLSVVSGRAQLLLRVVDQGPVRRSLEIIDRAGRDGAEVVCRIQQFIRQHDGDLNIASAVGPGTPAPIRRPPMTEPGAVLAPTRRVSTGSGLRVLLVDDELDVRETLAEQLEAEGFLVHQAADAVDAVAQLERGAAVDLVVTDHGMPGTTGADLARIIKHRWPHLPVGLVTGWSESMSSAPTIAQGVDFVLGKPVSIARLLDAVVLVCPARSTAHGSACLG
jgi:DNA-binding response OmpR family regulator